MEPQKPKYFSIQQIKVAKDAQMKLIEDLREKQWNDLSTGTDEIQVINTKNVQMAKQGLVDLDYELTDAYGLGKDGYLNKDSKTYGQGMLNAYGNIGDGLKAEQARKVAGYNKGRLNAYGNIGDGLKAEQERKALEANRAYYKSFKPNAKPADGKNGAEGNPFGESYYFDKDGKRVRGEKPITPTQSLLDDMFNAGGKGMPEDGENEVEEAIIGAIEEMENNWNASTTVWEKYDDVNSLLTELHFDRNDFNTNLPLNPRAAEEAGYILLPPEDSKYHQFTASEGEPNLKYVSSDGKKEVVYNASGEVITDPIDVGTYNYIYSDKIIDKIGHALVDVIPYFLLGNAEDDPTDIFDRIMVSFE